MDSKAISPITYMYNIPHTMDISCHAYNPVRMLILMIYNDVFP